MSGFRKSEIQSKGLRPGRRIAPKPTVVWVFDLDHKDARQWHQPACEGETCWCADTNPTEFLGGLLSKVIEPAGFRVGMGSRLGPDSVVLGGGPGFDKQDESPLRKTIAGES